MTVITVLAGERTIGGTQIVVEDQGARLLFDAGLAFEPASDPFWHVHRRLGRELADLFTLGLAPFIPDLYSPLHTAQVDVSPALPPAEGPIAVALSHSHLDHSHVAGFINPEIPVYALEPATRIVRVLAETGASLGGPRELIPVKAGGYVTVGPMRAHFVPVDHDVGGASGLIIETSDGVIAYSGDLRLHGAYPERTLAFAREAHHAGARLLVLEGTRLAPPPEAAPAAIERVEGEVAPTVRRVLEQIEGLGVILITPENGERVVSLMEAAAQAGRQFVIDLEQLAFVRAALGALPSVPFAVFPSAKRSTDLPGRGVPPTLRDAATGVTNWVTAEEIARRPGDYLLSIPFTRFADLLDMNAAGGVVLTANGPPLGPFDPVFAHLGLWAERLGMQVVDAGSTGHASPRDLALIAALSGAPTVMAMHSRYPELMPVAPERLLLPQRGHHYQVRDLKG